MPARQLEKVIYFASYIVTFVDRERIDQYEQEIEGAMKREEERIHTEKERAIAALQRQLKEAEMGVPEEIEVGEELAEGEEGESGMLSEEELERQRAHFQELIDQEERNAEEAVEELHLGYDLLQQVQEKQLLNDTQYRLLTRFTEMLGRQIDSSFIGIVRAGLGAEAVRELLVRVDLDELAKQLRQESQDQSSQQRRSRAIKRLQIVEAFRKSGNRPEWMILEVIPVLPPDLRPMVQLDGGRFAASDLNDLYRRIINRNNRLQRIIEINAPESIINHEKRLLQEAVDALIDNSRRTRPVTGSNKRPLKSLSDMLRGKEGRFRKNLLGKRVDYSGRSVIVVGPELKLHQCGLPKEMALELFKPFVMRQLVEDGRTTNIKTAKRMVDRQQDEVWDALDKIIKDHPILLNRAPTLHRLGIQAFEPVLVDGKAIQIHPLVCAAFNADFDGDAMSVHVPLSAAAQAEARILMMSTQNLFSPAHGRPLVTPTYDIVLGCFYLTQQTPEEAAAEPRTYGSADEAILAYEMGELKLHDPILVRLDQLGVEAVQDGEVVTLAEDLANFLYRIGAEIYELPFGAKILAQGLTFVPQAKWLEQYTASSQAEGDGSAEAEEEQGGELVCWLRLAAEGAQALLNGQEVNPAQREALEVLLNQTWRRWEEQQARGELAEITTVLRDLVEIGREIEQETALAIQKGELAAGTEIRVRVVRDFPRDEEGKPVITTVGRVLFNEMLPLDLRYVNEELPRKELGELITRCYKRHGQLRTVELLDEMKRQGFHYATQAGITISVTDLETPPEREQILRETEKAVEECNQQFRNFIMTAGEREQEVTRLWVEASDRVYEAMINNIRRSNPVFMMAESGARGSKRQITQLAGMRGLMADASGRLIEALPIKSNFREGLTIHEYFISTHGARKGLADTALRTADAGYLTRRMVDVAQDVIIKAVDCGTTNGITVGTIWEVPRRCPRRECRTLAYHTGPRCKNCGELLSEDLQVVEYLQERIAGRIAAETIYAWAPRTCPECGQVARYDGPHCQACGARFSEEPMLSEEVLVEVNEEISDELAERLEKEFLCEEVSIRSPMTCDHPQGVCARCYGRDLATKRLVEVGEAVGIIAAQSIGEPGTQLTMRTFHTGGVAGQYLTGVADVKKKKQDMIRQLSRDIEQGRVTLDQLGSAERERNKAIQDMLKVLEEPSRGLLRVVELFEARRPKGQAITTDVEGVVADIETKGLRKVIIHSEQSLDAEVSIFREATLAQDAVSPETGEVVARAGTPLNRRTREILAEAGVQEVVIRKEYLVPYRGYLEVRKGDVVSAGDRLTEGPLNPQEVLALKGVKGVQDYIVSEIQKVYREQGVEINDKHVEIIVRQMLKRREVIDGGDTNLLPGQKVDRFTLEAENARVREQGGREAVANWMLMGITDASLATDSFLSAASFQKTTRVLTEAAVYGREDYLVGLKENVIIGRLIPAGTGATHYRNTKVVPTPAALRELGGEAEPLRAVLPSPEEEEEDEETLEEARASWGKLAGFDEDDFSELPGEEFLEETEPVEEAETP